MDFEKMSLDELKEYAKSKNITVGNIGREKLIERIKEKESESNIAESVFNDMVTQNESSTKNDFVENKAQQSLAESISSAIDDLDDSCKYVDTNIEDLPIWDGSLYDCDFNQAVDMPVETKETIMDLRDRPYKKRKIRFDKHCYACTAGQGSSCGGSTA